MTLLERVAAARAAGDPMMMIDAVPYAAFIGMSAEVIAGRLVCRLRHRPSNIGNPILPAIHGGVIGAFLESTAIFHLIWDADAPTVPRTINVSIDYLRPGRPLDAFAAGTVTKQGRRVVNVRIEAWQDAPTRPIAAAHGHFLLTNDAATSAAKGDRS